MNKVQSEPASIYIEPHVTNADAGCVRWAPTKSIWSLGMYTVAVIGGCFSLSLENFAVFLVTSALTLCFGHSLGMHRRLIHQSYECPKWLEYLFVHLGTVVGLAGPFGMCRTHDTRDWAQRQTECHPYFSHQSAVLKDWWWQVNCELELNHPPAFCPPPVLANDRIYQLMERTWMFQQLPLAVILYTLGGIEWLVWGIAVRVAVSITGHWLIGYFAHNRGHRSWHIEGASVQGYNIKFCGLITFGECWHNNHHAFPGSAKLGLKPNQVDPGWWVICILQKLSLIQNIKLPDDLPNREELIKLNPNPNSSG